MPHVAVEVQPFIEEYLVKPLYDEDGVQATSAIGTDGREYPDPVPMSPPVGYTPPNDLMTMIQTMIRHEKFKEAVASVELETEEEANDFEVEDDPMDLLTPYEKVFEPPAAPPPAAASAATAAAASPGNGHGTPAHSNTGSDSQAGITPTGQPEPKSSAAGDSGRT